MPFLGSTPAEQYQSLAKQTITGDGSTAYTLSRSVTNAYDMEVFINNVRQEPDTSYSAAGNTITFTAAVTSSDSCYIIYQGQSVGSINPPAGSVGGTQIQNTSVTNAHLAGAITDAKLHSSLDLSSKTLTMPAGHIIQTQHATMSSQIIVSTTGAYTDILSCSITTKFANSKILIQAAVPNYSNNPNSGIWTNSHYLKLHESGTGIIAAYEHPGPHSSMEYSQSNAMMHMTGAKPVGTYAYTIRVRPTTAGDSHYYGRVADGDSSYTQMVVQEIAQ